MTVKDAQAGAAAAAGDEAAGPAAPVVVGGRYEIDPARPLATGGVCHVYRGRDRRTRGEVAAKTLRAEYRNDAETRARFRREARLIAFLNHPNIVRVEAFVEEKDASWVVLEYLPGGSVRDVVAARAPLPPEEVVPILDGAAAGLAHIHARRLVHLDVKPENLLFAADGTVKLIDLGLAQPAGRPQEATARRTLVTAAYLAPEQACGDPVEPATDVYALGCVVYELLTGRPPFVLPGAAQSLNDLVTVRLHGEPEPPSAIRPDLGLPAWVDDVLRWALARDPALRFSDADAFARLFRTGVEGEPAAEMPRPALPAPLDVRHRPVSRFDRQWVAPRPAERVVRAVGAAPEIEGERPLAIGRAARRLRRWERPLWLACAALLVANLLVGGALLVTRGGLPPFVGAAGGFAPGASARVAGAGLLARSAPSFTAEPLGEVPSGTRLRLDGPPVVAGGQTWWPASFDLGAGPQRGWVAEAWLAPE